MDYRSSIVIVRNGFEKNNYRQVSWLGITWLSLPTTPSVAVDSGIKYRLPNSCGNSSCLNMIPY